MTRKLLIIAAIAMVCAVGCMAQERWQFGVGAGGDISFVNTSEGSEGKLGGYVALSANYNISKHFSIGTGAGVTYRKYKTGTFDWYELNGVSPDLEFRTSTIDVPARLIYRQKVSRCELFGHIGPVFNYVSRGEFLEMYEYRTSGWKNMFRKYNYDYHNDFDFHRVYLSAEVGIGVRFAHHHCINTTYSQSLTRIEAGTSAHLRSFSLGYAYMF